MSDLPEDLKFAKTHEWVRVLDDGLCEVGISDHAQAALGDLVFVELPEVDAHFSAGDAAAVVESVKAAADVYAPLGGVVVAVNEQLADAPELVNEQPFGDGWLMRIEPDDAGELDDLHDAANYAALLEDEDDDTD